MIRQTDCGYKLLAKLSAADIKRCNARSGRVGSKTKVSFIPSKTLLVCLLIAHLTPVASPQESSSQERPPIIDMHLHALPADVFRPGLGYADPAKDELRMREHLAEIKRSGIVAGIVSGPLDTVLRWKEVAGDSLLASLLMPYPHYPAPSPGEFHKLLAAGRIEALGEITAQYMGLKPDDSSLTPYFELAEEFDIPARIHMGIGPPNAIYGRYKGDETTMAAFPKYRLANGNPLLLEDLLARHPKLRLYVMHAGYPFLEEMIGVLHMHRRVYVEIGVLAWLLPPGAFQGYLRGLIDAGNGKRIMFGSDQMDDASRIGKSIDTIESVSFLSEEQRRDIFYNNAARFLRLDEETIAKHHGRQ